MATTTGQDRLPRLLAGIGESGMVSLDEHLEVYGPPADLRAWTPGGQKSDRKQLFAWRRRE